MAGEGRSIGYCTNVHAGATLDETRANLETHALAVKKRFCPQATLGIGLWLSASAARQLRAHEPAAFAGWLDERGLDVFTINGFPYGDFHRRVVKRDVYRPDWRSRERLDYTLDLAHILAAIVPEGGEGGISTLPVGWGPALDGAADAASAASNLVLAVDALAEIERQTGRLIHLDLEPEPGCFLQRSEDVARFFERHLLGGANDERVRRHLRVCHDICHAAVMFEEQADCIGRYDDLGVRIGKVQVSSAVRARPATPGVREALAAFREERYLHQTVIRGGDGRTTFFEDLPEALAADHGDGEWRVHFHVPIHLERLGVLDTTRDDIERIIDLLSGRPDVKHWEVETYAWDVLPAPHRGRTLADDIAEELEWLSARF